MKYANAFWVLVGLALAAGTLWHSPHLLPGSSTIENYHANR